MYGPNLGKAGVFGHAVLIRDNPHHHYIPLAVRVLEQFLDAGFVIREDIIKLPREMKGIR